MQSTKTKVIINHVRVQRKTPSPGQSWILMVPGIVAKPRSMSSKNIAGAVELTMITRGLPIGKGYMMAGQLWPENESGKPVLSTTTTHACGN